MELFGAAPFGTIHKGEGTSFRLREPGWHRVPSTDSTMVSVPAPRAGSRWRPWEAVCTCCTEQAFSPSRSGPSTSPSFSVTSEKLLAEEAGEVRDQIPALAYAILPATTDIKVGEVRDQTPNTGLIRHPSSNNCHNWLRHRFIKTVS